MILVSTESTRSLESAHANEGAIKGHHAGERITCLLRLDDDFADFFIFCSFLHNGWPNHKIEKIEHLDTYLSHKTTKTYGKHEDKMSI